MTWKERRRAASPPPLWFNLIDFAVGAIVAGLVWYALNG